MANQKANQQFTLKKVQAQFENLRKTRKTRVCFRIPKYAGTAIKVLVYDGQGFWLCQKRGSTGHFRWWPGKEKGPIEQLAAHELQMLLWNSNPSAAVPLWKKIKCG